MTAPFRRRWRIAPGQRLSFEDFDDGIVLFDSLAGSTHVLDPTAAEALAVVGESPGLDADTIRKCLVDRLALAGDTLRLSVVEALLERFELLNLLRADPP